MGPGGGTFRMGGMGPMGHGRQPARTRRAALRCTLEELKNGCTKQEELRGKTYSIDVKAGFRAGTMVECNDVTFVVEEQPHRYYRRDGDDLNRTVQVSWRDFL